MLSNPLIPSKETPANTQYPDMTSLTIALRNEVPSTLAVNKVAFVRSALRKSASVRLAPIRAARLRSAAVRSAPLRLALCSSAPAKSGVTVW